MVQTTIERHKHRCAYACAIKALSSLNNFITQRLSHGLGAGVYVQFFKNMLDVEIAKTVISYSLSWTQFLLIDEGQNG